MKCPKCPEVQDADGNVITPIHPQIRDGRPAPIDGSVFIVHIYTCNDPRCENYSKDIGEVRTDIFDNSKQTEVIY